MREMKDSGIPWLGNVPKDWNIYKVKNIARRKSDKNMPDAQVLSLYRELGIVVKSDRDDNHNVTSEDTSNYKYVEKNDLVVNKMKAWQGSIAVSSYNGIVSPAYYVYRFSNYDIYPWFVHYVLRCKAYLPEYRRLSGGIRLGQWDLSDENFKNIPLPIPSAYTEQKRIADYLDSKCYLIDSIITKQEAVIEKLKEYKLSVITEAVTKGLNPNVEMKDSGIEWIGYMPSHWTKARLSDVTDRIIVGLATSVTPYYRPIGTVLLRNLNIKEGYLDDSELLYLDEDFANSQVGKFIEKDDVLTVHTGSNLGLTSVVPDKYSHTLSFTTLITSPTKSKLDSKYLMYTINSGLGKSEIDKLKCGDIKPNLNVGQFKYFTILMPSLEEQQLIVEYLDNKVSGIDSSIKKKEIIIEHLKEYKKSLIYEVVTGKKEV